MSIGVMTHVWEHSEQKGSALLLLLAIADHAHDDGTGAYPAVQTLADKVRMTKRNTQRLLHELAKTGELIIETNAGPHKANLYAIPLGVKTLHPASQGREDDADGSARMTSNAQEGDAGVIQTIREPSEESSVKPSHYLYVLRAIPGWWERGEPHLAALLAWKEEKGITDDQMERSAIGLSGANAKTLKGYSNLKGALQVRINKGWDRGVVLPPPEEEGAQVVPLDLSSLEGQEEATSLWARAMEALQELLPVPSYNTWCVDLVALGFIDGTLILRVPNAVMADHLNKRLVSHLERATDCRVEFHVETSPAVA